MVITKYVSHLTATIGSDIQVENYNADNKKRKINEKSNNQAEN